MKSIASFPGIAAAGRPRILYEPHEVGIMVDRFGRPPRRITQKKAKPTRRLRRSCKPLDRPESARRPNRALQVEPPSRE